MSFSVVPSWQRPPSTSFPGQSQPPSTASPPGGSPSATLDARLPRAWGVCWLTTGPPSSAQRCVGALDSPVTAEQKAGILILVNKRLYSMNTCTQGTHQFGLLNLFILRTLLRGLHGSTLTEATDFDCRYAIGSSQFGLAARVDVGADRAEWTCSMWGWKRVGSSVGSRRHGCHGYRVGHDSLNWLV